MSPFRIPSTACGCGVVASQRPTIVYTIEQSNLKTLRQFASNVYEGNENSTTRRALVVIGSQASHAPFTPIGFVFTRLKLVLFCKQRTDSRN